MPEICEVEMVAMELADKAVGHKITDFVCEKPMYRDNLPSDICERLREAIFFSVRRNGKSIYFALKDKNDNDIWLRSHLGMTGGWFPLTVGLSFDGKFGAHHRHIRYRVSLDNGTKMIYADPRGFGALELLEPKFDFNQLPVDILNENFDLSKSTAWKTKIPVIKAMMDQKYFPGIGAYLTAELLFRSGIHPLKPCDAVKFEQREMLNRCTHAFLKEILSLKGASFVSYLLPSGENGGAATLFKVYGREDLSCVVCGEKIIKINKLRGSHHCPVCQPI